MYTMLWGTGGYERSSEQAFGDMWIPKKDSGQVWGLGKVPAGPGFKLQGLQPCVRCGGSMVSFWVSKDEGLRVMEGFGFS